MKPTPTTGSTDGHTPRTDALSATVQNQNWGFRDMQILARKLETELTTLRRVNAALVKALQHSADTLDYIAYRKESKSVTQLHLGEVAETRLKSARAALALAGKEGE